MKNVMLSSLNVLVSFSALLASLMLAESLYRDAWNFEAIYHLARVHTFFISDAGKQVAAPFLVMIGAFMGVVAAKEAKADSLFWISFSAYLATLLVLLWVLISLSPPLDREIKAVLEAHELDAVDNPLRGIVSICVASLAAWLSNRFAMRISPS